MKTVKMRWGYNMPGKKGQHIPGHSYKYKEGLFTKQEYTQQLVVYSNSSEYNHMFKAFEVALRESTRLAKQYNLEIDYMDSTVDDYIDPNDAIEPDEHTIVIKTGINIDTAPSYYGIKIVFRKSN